MQILQCDEVTVFSFLRGFKNANPKLTNESDRKSTHNTTFDFASQNVVKWRKCSLFSIIFPKKLRII
jgi:hypothetical protein